MGHHNKESLSERVLHDTETSGSSMVSVPLERGDGKLVHGMVASWNNKVLQDREANLYVDPDITGHHPVIVANRESILIYGDTPEQAEQIAKTVAENVRRR